MPVVVIATGGAAAGGCGDSDDLTTRPWLPAAFCCALCVCCRVLRFGHNQPIIKLRSLRTQAVSYQPSVRGPWSNHRRGSVGVPVSCRARHGLASET